jgi:predicted ATP-grasp superfamily ATP-dependent carboligase
VILLGVEPNYRWRTFNELVIGLARDLGVELVVTLGALLADVPHTRPAPVTGAASDLSLVEELGLQPSRYEGPTGIVGVLHDACRTAGISSVSLWSAVPHYVSLAPSPRAAKALCDRLGELLGVDIDLSELEEQEETYAEQISEAVASDPETQEYVEELERRSDTIDELLEDDDLPTGESLAAELSQFLRDRESGEPPGGQ